MSILYIHIVKRHIHSEQMTSGIWLSYSLHVYLSGNIGLPSVQIKNK